MKTRHYVIFGLLILVIALMWVDKIMIANTARDVDTFWENRSQRTSESLSWYSETLIVIEENLLTEGKTLDEIEEFMTEKKEGEN